MKTAAIVIIGNEILSGKVEDTNSVFLAGELRALGVDLKRVTVIPDETDEIATEVRSASERYDYVFTSGGVGPTHDDVTMQGIADAFGLALKRNPVIIELLSRRCSDDLNDPALKMADLPEGAELCEAEKVSFPVVCLKNIYIFPGIPEFLVKKFHEIKERFRSSPFILKKIYINEEECYIAEHLTAISDKYDSVDIGSYPKLGIKEYQVIVTIESRDADVLDEAYQELLNLLPEGTVVKVTE